jgi:hypothetical protein
MVFFGRFTKATAASSVDSYALIVVCDLDECRIANALSEKFLLLQWMKLDS